VTFKLNSLVAATHTPFDADGQLNLAVVEKQAERLIRDGVAAVFVAGTTGENASLTVQERLDLARRWSEVVRGTKLRLVVHVGSNCLADARVLAAQAQSLGADAIAALAPNYFKPKTLEVLVACSREVASAAPALPFYYYDIPAMTGVLLPMPDFLSVAAERIPTLAGMKFTNPDLTAYQKCLQVGEGRFDIPFGMDERLLAALAVGATGAVGSTYNFAAPIFLRLIDAFHRGDLAAARVEQYRAVQLIDLLRSLDYIPATKAVMGFLNIPVGPARLPLSNLTAGESKLLRQKLESLSFFEWIGR
jgi:N-acetylneuraminate lyase